MSKIQCYKVLCATLVGCGLQADVVELPTMQVVSAVTRSERPVEMLPVRAELISGDILQMSASRNIGDALELLPGARVENNCQNCGTSEILLLGLGQRYSQILFDGVPLGSSLQGVYGIDQIPTLFLDRIEVIKGGSAPAYGSGAVAGIINLIGHKPIATGIYSEVRHESVLGKPVHSVSTLADYVTVDRANSLSAYGQWFRQSPVDFNGDGFTEISKRTLKTGGIRTCHKSSIGEFRFDYNRLDEYRRGGNRIGLPEPLADIAECIQTQRDAASLHWRLQREEDWALQIVGGFAKINRESYYGGLFGKDPNQALIPESELGLGDNDQAFLNRGYRTYGEIANDQFGFTDNLVTSVDAQYELMIDKHNLTAGLQYASDAVEDVIPVSPFIVGYPSLPQSGTTHNYAVFFQDEWQLLEKWSALYGARLDKHSELSDPIFSPRAAIKYTPNEFVSLRATYSEGFRAPQAFDEDLHIEVISGNTTVTRQADDLEEERSRSYMLSAQWSPEPIREWLTLEANLFHTEINGTFTLSEIMEDANGESFRSRFNGPDAAVSGIELVVGCQPHSTLRADLGWVIQSARYDEAIVLYDDENGNQITSRDFTETPRHYGLAQINWNPVPDYSFLLSINYTGSMAALNERIGVLNSETKQFLVANFSASRSLSLGSWRGDITLGVKNITDTRQSDIESGADRDPTYFYGPRQPRTYFVSLTLAY